MKGKKIWGFEIQLMHDYPVGAIKSGKFVAVPPTGRIITYSIKLSSRVSGKPLNDPNRMFISDKSVHGILEHQALPMIERMGEEMGRMQVVLDMKGQVIRTEYINPFERIPGRRLQSDVFWKKGLASRIEQRLQEHLQKSYPGFSIRSSDNPSAHRIAQLQKRGVEPKEPIPMAEAIRLTRAQNRKNFQKHRTRTKTHLH